MALLLKKSIFYHAGRTAGHWVRTGLAASGLAQREIGGFHDWPSRVKSEHPEVADLFAFTFVRHPLHWLKSRWTHALHFGDSEMDCRSLRFAEFAQLMLRKYSCGPATAVFQPFIEGCQYVGRQENLRDDLVAALECAGETFNARRINSSKKIGVPIDETLAQLAKAPRALLEDILATEANLCAQFHYDFIPEDLIGEETKPPEHLYLVATAALDALEGNASAEEGPIRFEAICASPCIRRVDDNWVIAGWGQAGMAASGGAWRRILDGASLANRSILFVETTDLAPVMHAIERRAVQVRILHRFPPKAGVDAIAGLRQSGVNVDYVASLAELQAESAAFDCVAMTESLEQSRCLFSDVLRMAMFVKPGGKLAISFGVVEILENIPLLFAPAPDQGVFGKRSITFANKSAIYELLRSLGFSPPELAIHLPLAAPRTPLGATGDLLKFCGVKHDSYSPFGEFKILATRVADEATSNDWTCRVEWIDRQNWLWNGAPENLAAIRENIAGVWSLEHALASSAREDALLGQLENERTKRLELQKVVSDRTTDLTKLYQTVNDLRSALHATSMNVGTLTRQHELRSAESDAKFQRELEQQLKQRELLQGDLVARTAELEKTREELRRRTIRLESALSKLGEMTSSGDTN